MRIMYRARAVGLDGAMRSMRCWRRPAPSRWSGAIRWPTSPARAAAPVGAGFTASAWSTGSLWGQPMWGTWWVWDARLTSVLVLFFLYLGHIALMQRVRRCRRAATAPARSWRWSAWSTCRSSSSRSIGGTRCTSRPRSCSSGGPTIDPRDAVAAAGHGAGASLLLFVAAGAGAHRDARSTGAAARLAAAAGGMSMERTRDHSRRHVAATARFVLAGLIAGGDVLAAFAPRPCATLPAARTRAHGAATSAGRMTPQAQTAVARWSARLCVLGARDGAGAVALSTTTSSSSMRRSDLAAKHVPGRPHVSASAGWSSRAA